MPPELFEAHCRALAEEGWRGLSLAEAEDYFLHKRSLPRKSCLITFDDGYLDNYVYAEPILRLHGHHGVMLPVLQEVDAATAIHPEPHATWEDWKSGRIGKDIFDFLHERRKEMHSGVPIQKRYFCNWAEIHRMRKLGTMDVAPHSVRHDQVVDKLTYRRLHMPGHKVWRFGLPPYPILWGLPCFSLGHALARRAYTLRPELYDLVRSLVPQDPEEAVSFLNISENVKKVRAAVDALPLLGEVETEEAYRRRVREDLIVCRERFRRELGRAPVMFCWPWGDFTPEALEEGRKAGFSVFLTSAWGANRPGKAGAVRRFAVRPTMPPGKLLRRMRVAACAPLEGVVGWVDGRYGQELLDAHDAISAWFKRFGGNRRGGAKEGTRGGNHE